MPERHPMTIPSEPLPAMKPHGAAIAPWARGAQWVVGLAATMLLVISLGGYLYDRTQRQQIAAQHLRLIVTGPAQLQPGAAAEYAISTTAITGDPLPAQIELSLYSPDGKRVVGHNFMTDDSGRLQDAIPADMALGSQAELRVMALHSAQREEIRTMLAVEPARYTTQLAVDKPRYRPGETVFYRSLTLSRFGLGAERALPIHFEVLAPGGAVAPRSAREAVTDRGVGDGAYVLADDLPAGRYTLRVRSSDRSFAEQEQSFLVRRGGDSPPTRETAPGRAGEIEVRFYPEGGELVEGLENRVYFTSRSPVGKPLALKGTVVDNRGADLVEVETAQEGLGSFAFVPRGEASYRLKIARPAGIAEPVRLPAVSTEQKIVLTTGGGVFPAGAPLELNIRAAKEDIPLVVVARCRGTQVGQQTLVTSLQGRDHSSNPVVLPLDEQAGGVIRLTVYDYSSSPPRAVAERLVYRQMAQRLTIRLVEPRLRYAPGERASLTLLVTDEKGQPAPATVDVAVVDDKLLKRAGDDRTVSMAAYFLLNGEIERPADLEPADFYPGDDKDAATALDLRLGTQAEPQLAERSGPPAKTARAGPNTLARPAGRDGAVPPPLMFDNLSALQAKYQQSFSNYEHQRTQALRALTGLSFFGGLGLLLLVTMLGLMKVAAGMRLWAPAVSAAACCLWMGFVLMDPGRHDVKVAVPFASLKAPPRAESGDSAARPTRGEGNANANRPSDGDAVPEYTYAHMAGAAGAKNDVAETLYWHPRKVAGPDGRVQINFDLPDAAGVFRLRANAHGAGRLGSTQAEIIVRVPRRDERAGGGSAKQ